MNTPPTDGKRVLPEPLRQLVSSIFKAVPVSAAHADLFAHLIVDTDLRGVVSHGVMQVYRYVRGFQEGRTNPDPQVRVLNEGPVTAALSGDGGLGIVVANQAMGMAITKAKELGVGIVTTTYHDHIGSAGKYVRIALSETLVGMGLSGRNAAPTYGPERNPAGSVQGCPPMSVGAPAGPERPDFILDMGTVLTEGLEFEQAPATFFKSIGLAHVSNILSGTLGGQMLPEFDRRNVQYKSADQSGFFMALDIARFTPVQAFTDDMDHLMDEVDQMQPFPGYDEATLPGGPEWKRERQYAEEGIPLTKEAVEDLETLAAEYGLTVPW